MARRFSHEHQCGVFCVLIGKYFSILGSSLTLFVHSSPQTRTLWPHVSWFPPWSDKTACLEATACTTRTCPARSPWVRTAASSRPLSPVPPAGRSAAGHPTANELRAALRHRAKLLRKLGAGPPTGRRWSNATPRKNRRSPATSPPFYSSTTRAQCVCAETRKGRAAASGLRSQLHVLLHILTRPLFLLFVHFCIPPVQNSMFES